MTISPELGIAVMTNDDFHDVARRWSPRAGLRCGWWRAPGSGPAARPAPG